MRGAGEGALFRKEGFVEERDKALDPPVAYFDADASSAFTSLSMNPVMRCAEGGRGPGGGGGAFFGSGSVEVLTLLLGVADGDG